MTEPGSEFPGLRVLVVEDEPIVGLMLEDHLHDLKCQVLGPVATLPEAIACARGGQFDVAILDVNINGDRSDPVAELLDARGLPYLFATGYGRQGISTPAMVLEKPYSAVQLATALGRLLQR